MIGSPVGHSLSPAIHNAAFAAGGLDWVYVAFEVAPGDGARGDRRDARPRDRRAVGDDAAQAGRRRAPSTRCRRRPRRCDPSTPWCGRATARLVGHSTDGDGFVASLADRRRRRGRASPSPSSGAGAAARSVVDALGRAGAAEVVVVNRTAARAEEAASLAAVARVGTAGDIPDAGIVVNATSVGFGHRRGAVRPGVAPRRPGRRRPRLPPARTALLDAAAARAAARSTAWDARPPGRPATASCGPASPDPDVMRDA